MKRFLPLCMFFIFSLSINAQVNYEPVNKSIYVFLENLSIKGLIKFNDEVKPLSRMYIADKLTEITAKKVNLTYLEAEELDFYLKEFSDEIINKNLINSTNPNYNSASDSTYRNDFLRFGKTDRLRFFSYHDNTFTINVDPILGYHLGNQHGASYLHRWNGVGAFGSIGLNLGFNLNFRDNLEEGNTIDKSKSMTSECGINVLKDKPNSIEYSEVRAILTYNWNWGVISLGKDYHYWGSGERGRLILSDKAPSFPFIKLDISPVDWFRFTYLHGWLYSSIMDSSSLRYGLIGNKTFSQIPKFIAAHMFSVDIKENLTFSLGESIIYSDKIEPIYLIPILFFRLGDHYMGGKNSNTGSNAQIFSNLYYMNREIKAKFYTTVFIDELSVESLLKGGNLSAIGYTLGVKFIDPLIGNSSFTFEYTKISPFVYMNSNPVELYTSHNYQLGHWIGSNGYNIYSSYNQKIIRGFRLALSGELVKKGQKELPQQQYELPYPSFLYGAKYEERSAGIELSYEYIHDLFVKLNYKFTDISDDDKTRTPSYMLGKHHSFGISLYYGI